MLYFVQDKILLPYSALEGRGDGKGGGGVVICNMVVIYQSRNE